jgi:DNA-binding PadR family transcriptional regulator
MAVWLCRFASRAAGVVQLMRGESVSEETGGSISYRAALVLQALAQGHGYGFEVMRVTQLPSGTVYPLLRRLEAAGMVQSRWEDEGQAHADARPARRYYETTPAGAAALAAARERLAYQRALFERPATDGPGGGV